MIAAIDHYKMETVPATKTIVVVSVSSPVGWVRLAVDWPWLIGIRLSWRFERVWQRMRTWALAEEAAAMTDRLANGVTM